MDDGVYDFHERQAIRQHIPTIHVGDVVYAFVPQKVGGLTTDAAMSIATLGAFKGLKTVVRAMPQGMRGLLWRGGETLGARAMVQARAYEMTASHLGRSTTKAGKPPSATYITNQAKGTMGEIAGAQTLRRAGYTKPLQVIGGSLPWETSLEIMKRTGGLRLLEKETKCGKLL